MCWLFLQKADSRIKCIVSGVRRHSQDLPQGGLEVPCTLKFYGRAEELRKILLLTNNYDDTYSFVCCDVKYLNLCYIAQ
jgi:hypothetical protein